MLSRAYICGIIPLIERLGETQMEAIDAAAEFVFESWKRGGALLIARTNHCLHDEAIARAGGPLGIKVLEDVGPELVPMGPRDFSDQDVTDLPNLTKLDVVLIHTNSGTTRKVIEIALRAAAIGAKTVALTQLPYETSSCVTPWHPTGLRLHEVADLTIDLGGEPGDAMLALNRSDVRVAPSSGVTGMVAMWAILARACELVEEDGHVPFVLESLQLPGAVERNTTLMERWESTYVPFD